MSWDGIIGHNRQVQVLRAVLERERSAHAYLFVGEPGVGKRTVAQVVARALQCEAESAPDRPCGACRSCTSLLADHPDFFDVVPSGASIRIDQIRAIQRELSFRPTWNKRKVFCINLADNMTEQAQNALLKSIEEPPGFASFLLLSEHLSAILPTIRSRCVQMRFGRVGSQEIANALTERGTEPERAQLLAALSFGRPGAIMDADIESLLAQRSIVVDWVETLFRRPSAVWYVGEALEKERDRAPLLIDMLILWFRDVLLVRTGRSDGVVNRDIRGTLELNAENVSPQGLTEAISALLQLKQSWDRNANFRLALDVALINIQRGLRSA